MTVTMIQKMREFTRITVENNPIPNPLITDGIFPVDYSTIDYCDTTIIVENVQRMSNFVLHSCDMCAGLEESGTVNWILEPQNEYRSKLYTVKKEFDRWHVMKARAGNVNWMSDMIRSIQVAWVAFQERVLIYGDPTDNLPGLLYGSGIPQLTDTVNFYNNTMTGAQMVNTLISYADSVAQTTSYAYQTAKMIIPASLATILLSTPYNTQSELSVLDVVKTRLASLNGGVSIYQASSFNAPKIITMLPVDATSVTFHATPLSFDFDPKYVEGGGAVAGVVALVPFAAAIVRLN